jgi:hypothetical protein
LTSFACDRGRLLGPDQQTRWGRTKETNKVAAGRGNVNGAMKGGSHDCVVDEGAAAVDPRGALRQRLPDAEGPPCRLLDQDGYSPAPASSAICASASQQARPSLVTGYVVHVDHNLR